MRASNLNKISRLIDQYEKLEEIARMVEDISKNGHGDKIKIVDFQYNNSQGRDTDLSQYGIASSIFDSVCDVIIKRVRAIESELNELGVEVDV